MCKKKVWTESENDYFGWESYLVLAFWQLKQKGKHDSTCYVIDMLIIHRLSTPGKTTQNSEVSDRDWGCL